MTDKDFEGRSAPDLLAQVPDGSAVRLQFEVERLRRELETWTSGRRRKAWPVIESAPDGVHYAAELARAQGTEGGDEHDRLLREASQRLKALHDVAQVLLADRDVLSWMLRGMARRSCGYRKASDDLAEFLDRADAEVSRLREQLAAASEALADSVEGMEDMVGYVGPYFREKWDHDGYIARAKTALAGLVVSSSEVEAPQPQLPRTPYVPACPACVRSEQHTLDQLQWFHRDGLKLIAEAIQEARSATSEASQHKVFVRTAENGWWQGTCPTCDVVQLSPRKERVEDWKDQHEADTLRPKVEDAVLFAVAQDRVRRDKGERHTLEDVAAELELMDEGRPSGSERLAPRSGVELIADERARQVAVEGWTQEHDAKYGSSELVRAASCYLTPPEQRQMMLLHQDKPVGWPWDASWWKPSDDRVRELRKAGALIAAEIDRIQALDAAQAAQSEATPEEPSAHARVWTRENAEEPKPAVGDDFPNLVDAHGVRWVADERDDGFEGWRSDSHGFRIWRSWAQLLWQRGPLTEVPSPSLRKEGEDTPSPFVSSQEEKEGETDGQA